MTIDYSKVRDEEHVRYFVNMPVIGWCEMPEENYIQAAHAAMGDLVWSRQVGTPDSFHSAGIEGFRVTASNGRKLPESYITLGVADAKEGEADTTVLPPRVEKSANSVALTFPEGSYSDYHEVDGALVVVLSDEEYAALAKAQAPMSLERIADKIGQKAVPEDSFRAEVRDTVAETLRGVAQDMRAGKKTEVENPFKGITTKLRAVKDLLK